MTEVTLPLPPNRAQDTGHHMAKWRAKKAYRTACMPALYKSFGPFCLPGSAKFDRVHIAGTLYSWNKNDPDAVDGRLKWAIDTLVHYRIIPKDTAEHVLLGEIDQVIERKDRRLVLTIEELPDA